MAVVTQNEYIQGSDGETTRSFTFPYLKVSDVKVSLDGVDQATTTYTLPTATTIKFNTAPTQGQKIKIYRRTDDESLTATFYPGSSIKSEDLNDNFTQNLYTTQEVNARYVPNFGGTMTGDLNFAEGVTLNFEGATADAFETTLTVVDPTVRDQTYRLPNIPTGGSGTFDILTTGDTGSLQTAVLADDAVTGVKIADDTIDSNHYVAGSIDNEHLAADSVTGAKIADDTINSEHYVAGSIDTEHVADSHVTTAKLANNAVTTVKINNSAVDSTKLANASVVTDRIADSAVATAKIADSAVTAVKLANDAITVDKIADGAVGTSQLADNSVTLAKMADVAVGTAELVDDAVTDAKIADNAVKTAHILDSNVTTAKLNNASVSTTKLADDAVTATKIGEARLVTLAAMQSGTASQLAGNTALTSDIADLNQLDGLSKQTSITDVDTSFPTSGAVVEYVTNQFNTVGGLKVIENEDAFPTTQPSSGVVISISDAQGIIVGGTGQSTNCRTSGYGSDNVTINSFPSSLYNETLAAGVGLMVSSTGNGNIYNYHKLLAAETDVKQLSDDINDFNARYRVGSSNPTSALDAGDLFFNTTTQKMLVYDSTDSAWEEVQSVGNFYISTFTEAFDGSRTAFTVSNAPTSAQQLIISINGVIQKPNAGTGAPSEGFTLSSSTVTFSSAPASGSDYFAIVMGSTVNIGTPSDNTVTTAILQNASVTLAKMASESVDEDNLYISNAGTNGQYLQKQSGNDGGLTWATVENDKISEFNSSAEVIGTDSTDTSVNGEFLVKLQHGASNGAAEEALRLYHNGGYNILDVAPAGGTTSANSELRLNHLSTTNCWAEIDFVMSGANSGTTTIRSQGGSNFEIFPQGNTSKFYLTDSTCNISSTNLYSNHHSPIADSTYDLGLDGTRWRNAYVDTYYGDGSNLTGVVPEGTAVKSTGESGGTKFLREDGDGTCSWQSVPAGVGGANGVDFNDSVKARLGTDNDIEIYHDGNSYITNTSATQFAIQGDDLKFRSKTDLENYLVCTHNAAVDLYYNGSKKFETTNTGTNVTGVHVDDGATHDGDVSLNGASYNAWWDKSDNSFKFDDEAKIKVGTGGDLEIFHSSDDNYISAVNNKDLIIRNTGNAAITLQTQNSYNVELKTNAEDAVKCIANGAVELYHDNSKKLETYANGITITGGIAQTGYLDIDSDTSKLRLGDDQDLEIYHTGSHAWIKNTTGYLHLQAPTFELKASNGETQILASTDGSVKLYNNNKLNLETTGGGVKVSSPDGEATLQIEGFEGNAATLQFNADEGDDNADYFRCKNNGSNEFTIENYSSGSWEKNIQCNGDGGVELFYDNTQICYTSNDCLSFPDGKKLFFGGGNDLQLYHVGAADSYIDVGASGGDLYIRTNGTTTGIKVANNQRVSMPEVYSTTIGETNRDVKIESNGQLGYTSSVRASKINIADLTDTSWVFDLQPKSFNYRKQDANGDWTNEAGNLKQWGLIAEEVETVEKDLCFYEQDGTTLAGVHYSKLITPLVKIVQDQKTEIDTLKTQLTALTNRVTALEAA